jgi:hypothetical protein
VGRGGVYFSLFTLRWQQWKRQRHQTLTPLLPCTTSNNEGNTSTICATILQVMPFTLFFMNEFFQNNPIIYNKQIEEQLVL